MPEQGFVGRIVGMGKPVVKGAYSLLRTGINYGVDHPIAGIGGALGLAGLGYLMYRNLAASNHPTTSTERTVIQQQPLREVVGQGYQNIPNAFASASQNYQDAVNAFAAESVRPSEEALLKRRAKIPGEREKLLDELGLLNLEQYNLQKYSDSVGLGI